MMGNPEVVWDPVSDNGVRPRAELHAQLHSLAKTRVRLSTSVYQDLGVGSRCERTIKFAKSRTEASARSHLQAQWRLRRDRIRAGSFPILVSASPANRERLVACAMILEAGRREMPDSWATPGPRRAEAAR
jgi:hypothetical protein